MLIQERYVTNLFIYSAGVESEKIYRLIMTTYFISFSSANCKYSISVNDFIILADSEGYQLNTEVPFNQLISDKNSIQIQIWPINGENILSDIVSFTCAVKIKESRVKGSKEIFGYNFSDSAKMLPALQLNKVIVIDHEAVVADWTKAEKIEINDATLAAVKAAYGKLWNALKTGDWNSIKQLIMLREKTYASCYGTSLNERLELSRSTYQSYFSNTTYELYEFLPDSFPPKLQCYGKIISLEDSKGFHPTFYLKRDESGSVNIQFYFALVDGTFRVVL